MLPLCRIAGEQVRFRSRLENGDRLQLVWLMVNRADSVSRAWARP